MSGIPGAETRDHGGGLDAAVARWGGQRRDWIDLSTGINPVPYPLSDFSRDAWTALPDHAAMSTLLDAARTAWACPDEAAIIAAPGASALIARLPMLVPGDRVSIPGPTYNEHAAAFALQGFSVLDQLQDGVPGVIVHPNNPDGRIWQAGDLPSQHPFLVIDESFADVIPDQSLSHLTAQPGVVVLKSFGKFWGLAGLRLGFAIGLPETVAPLADALGPWPVAGPALEIGAKALRDLDWAHATRQRLAADAARLDHLMARHGAVVGGTDLFRLYDVGDATAFRNRLAKAHIWSRIFPYSDRWVRLGLPHPDAWDRVEAAL